MSKYLKMMAMKSGGKVAVQKASIGRLIGLGARKGVEMLTVSKSAIQKGAKDKVARDKFQKSLKDFQRGKPEGLENMKVLDKSPQSGISGSMKEIIARRPKTASAGAAAGAAGASAVAVEAGRRIEKSKAFEEKTFLNALRKIVKGE
jgi:hypothetical protein